MKKTRKPKVAMVGNTPITPISAKEQSEIKKRIEKRHQQLRKRYPEVHGKVVDFINHTVTDGTLYFSLRFRDKTNFSLRYSCGMFVVGADISDMSAGDLEIIREYMKPIPH
jgi:hypothetical protein